MALRIYTTGRVVLGNTDGATGTATINISNSQGDFLLEQICGIAIQSSLKITTWAGQVQISLGVQGNLFDNPIAFDAIAGDGRTPFVLPEPIVIPQGSSLVVQFTNRITTATTVELTFLGSIPG